MTEQTKSYKMTFGYFWKVFLMAAFPIHAWNLFMVFKDAEFMIERSEMWGTIGYAGYSLIEALVESLIIAILLWAISLLLPRKWTEPRTLTTVISVYFVFAGASAVEMAAYAFEQYRISKQFLYGLETYPTLTIGLIVGAILLAIVALMLLIFKTKKGESGLYEFYTRLTLLSYLYLVMDIAGIVVVIIRNMPAA